ncbi:hypothetical protein ABIE13_003276 [Ottowia thiooxydans]|uniref:Uncharacterized protein n=1 Tax=Ottowia thiooxydans TaxID=219182 RepID=A0ABV2QC06_9BURK
MCARRRTYLFFAPPPDGRPPDRRPKKSRQKKGGPKSVPMPAATPHFATGNLRCLVQGRRGRTPFVHFALFGQTAAAS